MVRQLVRQADTDPKGPVHDRIPEVTTRTRLGETTETIRQAILDGILPSGSRVKDVELAAALGVSRPTLREAARQLVYEGYLVHEPYRGLRVATIDDETVVHIAEVRAALETLAAQRLAEIMDEPMLAQLRAALVDLEQARKIGEPAALNNAHIAFHRLMVTLSGNPILAETWGALELRARLEMKLDFETRPDPDRIVDDHRSTIRAIESRDAARIATYFADHVMRNAREVIRQRHGAPAAGEDESPATSGHGRSSS